jgi:hypothetical protein
METLEKTLRLTHDWAVDRMHDLCSGDFDLESIEDACAIQQEFSEWLNPNLDDHEIVSLEYIGDEEDEGNIEIYEL